MIQGVGPMNRVFVGLVLLVVAALSAWALPAGDETAPGDCVTAETSSWAEALRGLCLRLPYDDGSEPGARSRGLFALPPAAASRPTRLPSEGRPGRPRA